MIKKLATAGLAAGLMLMSAFPAMGWYSRGHQDIAIVDNSSTAGAFTGNNTQTGDQDNRARAYKGEAEVDDNNVDQRITTGDARAKSTAVVVANTHVGDCDCQPRKGKDFAMVRNSSGALADTGLNEQNSDQDNTARSGKKYGHSHRSGGEAEVEENDVDQRIRTGNASARSSAWVVSNTHVGFGDDLAN